jgi:hypothetical protein
MSFLDALNKTFPHPTIEAAPKRSASAAFAQEQIVFTTKGDEFGDIKIQGVPSSVTVAVSGFGFQVVQEKGRLIIEPVMPHGNDIYQVLSTEVSSAKSDNGEKVDSEDVKQEPFASLQAPSAPRGYASSWKVMTPFSDPKIKNTNPYLVPQILAIDIRPKYRDGMWTIPKTLIICSTRPALNTAKNKVETVMDRLAASRDYPNLQLDTLYPMATGAQEDKEMGEAENGERPVLVCTPQYAKRLVGKGVEEIWWLNVRSLFQDWRDIDDLLQVFAEWDGRFPCPIKVHVCFGREDKEEAARILAWLEENKGISRVSGIDKIRSDLGLS